MNRWLIQCPRNWQPGWLRYDRTVHGQPPFVFPHALDHEPPPHPPFGHPLPLGGGEGRGEGGVQWRASLQRTVPPLERCSRSLFLLLLKLLDLLLRQRVILFGGLFQQLHAGGFVLVHSIALQITQAQLILGRRRTFRRTFLLKLDCLTERFLFGLFRVSGRRRGGNRRVVGRGNRCRRRF